MTLSIMRRLSLRAGGEQTLYTAYPVDKCSRIKNDQGEEYMYILNAVNISNYLLVYPVNKACEEKQQ